jgi:hypothetical protein
MGRIRMREFRAGLPYQDSGCREDSTCYMTGVKMKLQG